MHAYKHLLTDNVILCCTAHSNPRRQKIQKKKIVKASGIGLQANDTDCKKRAAGPMLLRLPALAYWVTV